MKIKIIVSLCLIFSCSLLFAQDAKEILLKSYDKCQSIYSGYYEMDKFMKYMSNKDTSKTSFNCYFKKIENDSIYSSAFHCKRFLNNEYKSEVLYTGDDFVEARAKDSTATITSKALFGKEIKSFIRNNKPYSPFTSHNSSPLAHDLDFVDKSHTFKFIGEEAVNNILCYHIQENIIPENDSTQPIKSLRDEYHYWINKTDYVPIKYSIAYDLLMNNDTMFQYEMYVLNKYEINNLKDENIITLNSIPSYYKLKNYVPYNTPKPLSIDTLAPTWELMSLTGEMISLEDLKGNLVLIDFFYKSCYPCMLALPQLQSLHEKYKDKGLKIIGINPVDKKEDGIASFLAKRGVTYTVLLGGNDVAKGYRVSGYPTVYLIDETGKIIFVQVGYGKNSENELEEIILKNLK